MGFVYLLELWLGYWREKYGIPDSLKRSTESFFRTQKEAIELKEESKWKSRVDKQYICEYYDTLGKGSLHK